MSNKFKISLMTMLFALALGTYSCQKQDPTEELAVKSKTQSVNEDLVSAMAANTVVQAFVNANLEFTRADENYYNSLNDEQKKDRRASLQSSVDNGTEFSDPFRGQSEVNEFYDLQNERAAQIRAAFPQLSQLSDEEQENVKMRVRQIIEENNPPVSSLYGGCHAGYNDCSWYCYDHGGARTCYNACRAGYYACTGQVAR